MRKDNKPEKAAVKGAEVKPQPAVAEVPPTASPPFHHKNHKKVATIIIITASVFAACALSFIGGLLVGKSTSQTTMPTNGQQQMIRPSGEMPGRRQDKQSQQNTNSQNSTNSTTNSTTSSNSTN